MFLVAAASSLAFWSFEFEMKRHQMRYYPRMRQIEVNRYSRASHQEQHFSAPRIDWSWALASDLFAGKLKGPDPAPQPSGPNKWYGRAWLLPHVMLPHVITFLLGSLLFLLGYCGCLGDFGLGAVKGAG